MSLVTEVRGGPVNGDNGALGVAGANGAPGVNGVNGVNGAGLVDNVNGATDVSGEVGASDNPPHIIPPLKRAFKLSYSSNTFLARSP